MKREEVRKSQIEKSARAPLDATSIAYGVAVFLSAFLLFQVQPLVGKAILPWFGGSSGVWTTCMLTFQALLFAGYAYAHVISTALRGRTQAILHAVLLAVAAATLPILPSDDWTPTAGQDPTLAIVTTLAFSVGLPFFVLSITGPLLQKWFSRRYPTRSPFRLYALSNAGSLLALLSYPFVFEPALSLDVQSLTWSVAFVVFALLCAACGFIALRAAPSQAIDASAAGESASKSAAGDSIEEDIAPSWSLRALWFALGVVPSVMLLSTTNLICLDIASVPFLWVLPLAIYLLSFVIAFDSPRWYWRTGYAALFAVAAAAVAGALLASEAAAMSFQVAALLLGLFSSCVFCHGELARLKPSPRRLTGFYLILAAAGLAGGILVSLLAPLLLESFAEFHLSILATIALMLIVFYRDRTGTFGGRRPRWAWAAAGVYAILIASALGYSLFRESRGTLFADRNFYGLLRVTEDASVPPAIRQRILVHGRIQHGAQFVAPDKRQFPTTYYGKTSGVGVALRTLRADRPRRIGVVGLGIGTLAAYGKAGDTIRFYELDPAVADVARSHFTFLSDSDATCDVILGDARLMLENETARGEPGRFDLLAIDAFSSDSIPTHLLTVQAFETYLAHLAGDGVLALHVSNRHFDLKPVLAAAARSLNLTSRVVLSTGDLEGGTAAEWVLLSRNAGAFDGLAFAGFRPLDAEREILWTDDSCSLIAALSPDAGRRLFVTDEVTDAVHIAHARRGIQALQVGDLDAAESALRLAIKSDDKQAGAWVHLGNVHHKRARPRDAIECYRRALALDPGLSEAHNNLGALLTAENPSEALLSFREAVRSDPRNARAHNNLANLLARTGELTEAIAHYELALAVAPDLKEARQNLEIVKGMAASSATP